MSMPASDMTSHDDDNDERMTMQSAVVIHGVLPHRNQYYTTFQWINSILFFCSPSVSRARSLCVSASTNNFMTRQTIVSSAKSLTFLPDHLCKAGTVWVQEQNHGGHPIFLVLSSMILLQKQIGCCLLRSSQPKSHIFLAYDTVGHGRPCQMTFRNDLSYIISLEIKSR